MEVAQAPSEEQPLFKTRGSKKSSTLRKRPATSSPTNSDSSGYSSASGVSDNGEPRIKRRRKTAAVTASSSTASNPQSTGFSATKYTGDRSSLISEINDATKHSNWFDENDPSTSTKNLLGTTRARPSSTNNNTSMPPIEDDGTYKGSANYRSFIQKNPNAPTKQVGPIKAPTNIRTITVTDFAPDVCKDYKQTGFCGFGDSCKFLHAREDYKQGWELDKEWENVGSKSKRSTTATTGSRTKSSAVGGDADDDGDDDALLENIPFACIICKKPYTNPIVTKCGHYFCEACALQRYRKSPSCAVCGAGTGGVFNGAKGLRKLLDKKRERARRRKEEARERGEEVSEEEEEGG
ncbi:MAG: hypothetical protein Q9201_002147 [Fulgogasparrea decipioides]